MEGLCAFCGKREYCYLGHVVNSGNIDEYIKESIVEKIKPKFDFELVVVVPECELFEGVKQGSLCEHLCSQCWRREFCRLGRVVNDGALDEYIREMVEEEVNPVFNFEVVVIIPECEKFEDEEV